MINDEYRTEIEELSYWQMNQKAKEKAFEVYLKSDERAELIELAKSVKHPIYP